MPTPKEKKRKTAVYVCVCEYDKENTENFLRLFDTLYDNFVFVLGTMT